MTVRCKYCGQDDFSSSDKYGGYKCPKCHLWQHIPKPGQLVLFICSKCGARKGETACGGPPKCKACVMSEAVREEKLAIKVGKKRNDPLLNNCPNCSSSLTVQSWHGRVRPNILNDDHVQKVSLTCVECRADLVGTRGGMDVVADRRVWDWQIVGIRKPKGTLTRKKGDWKFN